MSHTVSRSVHIRTVSIVFAAALLGGLLVGGNADAVEDAAPAAWPTTWIEYTIDGTPVADANGDENPAEVDIASGTCGEGPCAGAGSVFYAATADTVFFRVRLGADPYAPAKNASKPGDLAQYTYFVQLGDADGVLAVVGADGKAKPDSVYVSNGDASETAVAHTGPFDAALAGLRTVPVGDQFFLDFQVPLSTLTEVSGVTATTPVSLFFATGTDKNLGKIGKDLMAGTEVTFDGDDITLDPANTTPTATADTLTLDEDGSAIAGVLANDTDADVGDVLSIAAITSQPANGTATIGAGGITYTPTADWNGADSLVYQACDADLACATATLAITVRPVNDAPVVTGPGTLSVAHGGVKNTGVTVTDVDDDSFTFTISSPGGKGAAVVDSAGAVVYTATAGKVGADTLSVQACDDDGACDSAPVNLVIAAAVIDDVTVVTPKTPKTVTGPAPATPAAPAVGQTPAAPAGPETEALDATARRGAAVLAATGSPTTSLATVGAMLVLLGAGLLLATDRRGRRAA